MGPTREMSNSNSSDYFGSSSNTSSACSSSDFRYPPMMSTNPMRMANSPRSNLNIHQTSNNYSSNHIPHSQLNLTPNPQLNTTPYPQIKPTPYPQLKPTPYPKLNPTPYPQLYPTPYPQLNPTPYSQHKPTPVGVPYPSLLSSQMRLEQKQNNYATEKIVKCVLIGDDTVGKTSLIVSYTTNGYPKEYVPTAFDNYSVVVKVNNQPIRLQLCDTAGQTSFDTLRPLCYPDTDILLLCFSVASPASFYNLAEHWMPEFRNHCPDTPIILIGTQGDLRNDARIMVELEAYGESYVSQNEAKEFAQEIGALEYLECSSLTQTNLKLSHIIVEEVFDAALCAGLRLPVGQPFDSPGPMQKIKEKLKRNGSNHQVSSENFGTKDKCASHVMLKRQLSNQKLHQIHIQEKQLPEKPKKGWKKLFCNVFRARPNL